MRIHFSWFCDPLGLLIPALLTRSLPLARPSRACGFAHIPFAASQAAQVDLIRVNQTDSKWRTTHCARREPKDRGELESPKFCGPELD